MAKRTKAVKEAPPVAASVAPVAAQSGAHTVYVWSEGDVLTPVVQEHPRLFQITVGGATHHHVGETKTGEWIYRKS